MHKIQVGYNYEYIYKKAHIVYPYSTFKLSFQLLGFHHKIYGVLTMPLCIIYLCGHLSNNQYTNYIYTVFIFIPFIFTYKTLDSVYATPSPNLM